MIAPTGFGPTGARTTPWPVASKWQQQGFTWIIEGDVKSCFDEISHKAILRCIREKVIDNKFLALIQLLLKAGVEVDGVVHPTTKGVPQGGVVSPLLANAVLNKLDWFLHSKGFYGPNATRRTVPTQSAKYPVRPLRRRLVRVPHAMQSALCGTASGRNPRLPSGNLRIRTVCREDPGYPREGRVRLSGVQHLYGCWQSREGCSQDQGRPQGTHQHPVPVGRSPSLSPDAGKHLGPSCHVLRPSFVDGRTTSRLPITSQELPMGWTTKLSGLR